MLQVVAIGVYFAHSVAYTAWLPEISNEQQELSRVGAFSALYLFISEVGFVVIVTIISTVFKLGNVETCQVGQFLVGIVLLYSTFHIYGRLLRSRPKPPISTCAAVTLGLRKLYETLREIYSEFPLTGRFLIGVMFADSAMTAFPTVAGAYLVTQLGATGTQLGLVILTLLVVAAVFSPVANCAARACGARFGDARSAQPPLCAAILYLTAITAIAPGALRTRADLNYAFLFAALWGVGFGFYYSLMKPVFFYIVPGGQEVIACCT